LPPTSTKDRSIDRDSRSIIKEPMHGIAVLSRQEQSMELNEAIQDDRGFIQQAS
jgi:hypothetical protein